MNNHRRGVVAAIISCLLILIPSLAFASFDTDLSYGASGPAVLSLQQFLISQNLLPAADATGNFLSLTQSAVETFQTQQGITPASGYFGPLTRARVNAIAGSGLGSVLASLEAQLQQLEAEIAALTGTNTNTNTAIPTFSATPLSGAAPLTVTFVPTNATTLYAVNFGDGSTGSLQAGTITHTYTQVGTYTATFESDATCRYAVPICAIAQVFYGSLTVTVTQSTQAQTNANFTASPSSGEAPLAVSFSGTTPLSGYSIDYGDGSTPASVFSANCQSSCSTTSYSVLQSHTYTSGGVYTATLKDASGNLLGTTTITVSSSNQTSTSTSTNSTPLSFSVDQNSGSAPLTVNFTPSDNSTYYAVDFGDGSNASMQQGAISHTYTQAGTYTASFESDAACLHSSPACAIAQVSYGTLTITVTTATNCPPPQPTTSCNGTWQEEGVTTNTNNSCNIQWVCVLPSSPTTVSLTQTLSSTPAGKSFSISWSSANATSCNIVKSRPGTADNDAWCLMGQNQCGTTGSQVISPSSVGTNIYALTCTGTDGTIASTSISHVITSNPSYNASAPIASIGESSSQSVAGQSFIVAWASGNATSCDIQKTTPGVSGTTEWCPAGANNCGLTGSLSAGPSVTGTHKYTLTCTGPSGTATNSISHQVGP